MNELDTVVKTADVNGNVLTLSIICGDNPRARIFGHYYHINPDLSVVNKAICNDYPLCFSDSFEHASKSLEKWAKISRQNYQLTIDRQTRLF